MATMQARALASLVLALAACVPAASASEPADLRGRLLAAFMTGAPAPEAPAGDPLAALSARLRALQSGTDGSEPAQRRLLAEISAVARELDRARPPMPPEPVLRDYLSRRTPGAPTPPAGAAAVQQREASLVRAHALAAALSRALPEDDAFGSLTPAGASPLGANAEARAWAQAQLRGDFRVWPSPPPSLAAGGRTQELTAPSAHLYPLWNPSGNADFFASLGAYLHGVVDVRLARDSERLGRVERDGELACAGGWSVSCAVARTVGFAGAVMTGLEQQGAELTDADDGVRQRALLRLTPAALLESAPHAVAAVGEMRREDYSRASVGAASLAIGIAMLDATMLGPGRAARAGVLRATEKAAADDGARVAAAAGDVRAQALVAGEAAAPRTLDDAAVQAAYRRGDVAATAAQAAKAVDEAERLLLARGFAVRRTSRSGTLSAGDADVPYDTLEIVSGPRGSALGRILGSAGVRTMSERSGAPLRVFYDPLSDPLGMAGYFRGRDNSVNLSGAVVRASLGASPHPTLLHEFKHAHFHSLAQAGRPSPHDVAFHFKTDDDAGYRRYFSMEELSTFRRDLMQAQGRGGRSRSRADSSLRRGSELAARSQAALESLLARFNDPDAGSSITLTQGRNGTASVTFFNARPGELGQAELALRWGEAGERLLQSVRRDLDARAAAKPEEAWARLWSAGSNEPVRISVMREHVRVDIAVPGAPNPVHTPLYRKMSAEEAAQAERLRAGISGQLEASLEWARWHRAEFARIAQENDPLRGPLLLGAASVATSFGLAGGGDERWEPRTRVCGFDDEGDFSCELSGGRRR